MPIVLIPTHAVETEEVNRCHGPGKGHPCPTPRVTPTLRYYNVKYGGFTPRAMAEYRKHHQRQIQLVQAAWERKYGKKTTRTREFNTCHTPAGSSAGGQFCAGTATATATTAGLTAARLVRPGTDFDLVAAANAGTSETSAQSRTFLFNPTTRELIVGAAMGTPDWDRRHAMAFDAVEPGGGPGYTPPIGARGRRFDAFSVHGYLLADIPGSKGYRYGDLTIQIDRFATGNPQKQLAALHEFADWAQAYGGVSNDTPIWVREGPYRSGPASLRDLTRRMSLRGRVDESNPCHEPAGQPTGGRFCSTEHGPHTGLSAYPYAKGSQPIPGYLKMDVLRARRAGIEVFHHQQPEPVRDITGTLHDPLARSSAQRGEVTFFTKAGTIERASRGRIFLSTRGGTFEPVAEVWEMRGSFPQTVRKTKELTPESPFEKASVEDVVSTFRHEMGHIFDRNFSGSKSRATPMVLAREIRAWQYAVEVAPDHRISERQTRAGLESHGYTEFRKQELAKLWTQQGVLPNRYDLDEILERTVQTESKAGVYETATGRVQGIDPIAQHRATVFADRVLKSLVRYGDVLRKKGYVRKDTIREPYIQPNPLPLPGPRGARFI